MLCDFRARVVKVIQLHLFLCLRTCSFGALIHYVGNPVTLQGPCRGARWGDALGVGEMPGEPRLLQSLLFVSQPRHQRCEGESLQNDPSSSHRLTATK